LEPETEETMEQSSESETEQRMDQHSGQTTEMRWVPETEQR
jgi:hypothetical protein